MSYKISAKNRRLKRTLLSVISILKLESLNIDMPRRVVLFGVLLGSAGLFLDWMESVDDKHIGNSFKSILGITGYLLLLANLKMLFTIFSTKIKENIKFFFNFDAKDGVVIVFLGIFSLFTTINSVFVINNFSYFTSGIVIGKGVILSMIGYVFVLVGGILMLKAKTNTSVYVEGLKDDKSFLETKDRGRFGESNMRLPF